MLTQDSLLFPGRRGCLETGGQTQLIKMHYYFTYYHLAVPMPIPTPVLGRIPSR